MARCKSDATANTSQLTRKAAASNSRAAPAHSRTATSNKRTVEEISDDDDELPDVSKIAMSKSARGKAPVVSRPGLGSIFMNGRRVAMLETFVARNESESCSARPTC